MKMLYGENVLSSRHFPALRLSGSALGAPNDSAEAAVWGKSLVFRRKSAAVFSRRTIFATATRKTASARSSVNVNGSERTRRRKEKPAAASRIYEEYTRNIHEILFITKPNQSAQRNAHRARKR